MRFQKMILPHSYLIATHSVAYPAAFARLSPCCQGNGAVTISSSVARQHDRDVKPVASVSVSLAVVCFRSLNLCGKNPGRATACSLRMQEEGGDAVGGEEAAPAPMNRAAKRAAQKDSKKTVCGCPVHLSYCWHLHTLTGPTIIDIFVR